MFKKVLRVMGNGIRRRESEIVNILVNRKDYISSY